jgi:hypothetical protein
MDILDTIREFRDALQREAPTIGGATAKQLSMH